MNPNNGENLETPTTSPVETTTTEPTVPVNPQGAEPTESPEEVAFNNLKGGTQDRVKAIISERDQIRAENERLKAFVASQAPQVQPPTDPSSPQVRDAVAQLDRVGVATKDYTEQLVNQRIGGLIYNFELTNLEKSLDGSDGKPKFERTEYQDFVQRNPEYQGYKPQDVYNIMYAGEILDAELKSKGVQPTKPNSSLRPVKTQVREEQWTPEAVESRLKDKDGPTWYKQNIDLVNKVLSEQTPQPQ